MKVLKPDFCDIEVQELPYEMKDYASNAKDKGSCYRYSKVKVKAL